MTVLKDKTIIGFAGRKRAGKTTICKHIRETKNATVITIANALKQLTCQLIGFETVDELNEAKDAPVFKIKLIPSYKQKWFETLSKELTITEEGKLSELQEILNNFIHRKESTVREILQFIGTDIIRYFRPNWHVEKMVDSINKADTEFIVIDDVRFPNERQAIEDIGGYNFYIIRPDLRIDVSNHTSETSLKWSDYNETRIIINMYDIDTMLNDFDDYLNNNLIVGAYTPTFARGACQFVNENTYFGDKESCSENEEKIIKEYVLPNLDKTGAFVIHTHNENMASTIENMLYKRHINTEGTAYTFVVWNPFIIENLKRWL